MPQPSHSPPAGTWISPTTHFYRCLGACLLAGGLACWVMHGMEAPWTGRTSSLVFRGDQSQASDLDHYRGALKFYFDTGNPRRSRLQLDQWISVGLWCGSFFVLLASLLGAATARWWARWIRHPDGVAPRAKSASPPRWSTGVLIFAMAFGAFLRVQTIGDPPSWDEHDNMKRNFHGYLEYASPEAAPVWEPAGLKGALWENTHGNNPYLYSLLSQLSQRIWRVFSGAPEERFSIVAIRMPALISGVLAIAALWWSLNRMDLTRVAPWAALMLSVHGLAIEFSAEARGHGLNLCCSALLLGLVWSALEGGRARTWFAFGAIEVCSVLSHPPSLYHVGGLNIFMAAVLLWRGWRIGDPLARCGFARWVLANTVAALFCFWVLAPALPQAALAFSRWFPTGDMGLAWNAGFFIAYASGLCANFGTMGNREFFDQATAEAPLHGWGSLSSSFGDFQQIGPFALWSLVCFPLLLLAGWRHAGQPPAGRRRALLLSVSIASGPLMILVQPHLTKGVVIFFWYIIFVTPAVISLAACGLTAVGDWLATRLRLIRKRDSVVAAVAGLATVWLLGISSSVLSNGSWRAGFAEFQRRPLHYPWQGVPGTIASDAVVRGRRNWWVSYQDGYLVLLSGYAENPAAWEPLLSRPLTSWGRLGRGGTDTARPADAP